MLTATLKIMRELAFLGMHRNDSDLSNLVTADQIKAAYEKFRDQNDCQDIEEEFRSGQFKTDIPAPGSRHYESRSVAAKLIDGTWVGWTYWYGGGKHGEPREMPWMEDAYHLTCVEEEKLVIVRTFTKG